MSTKVWAILRTKESWRRDELMYRRQEWLLQRDGCVVASPSLWEVYHELNKTDLVWLAHYKGRRVTIEGDNKLIITCPASPGSPVLLKQILEIKAVEVEELARAIKFKAPVRH